MEQRKLDGRHHARVVDGVLAHPGHGLVRICLRCALQPRRDGTIEIVRIDQRVEGALVA